MRALRRSPRCPRACTCEWRGRGVKALRGGFTDRLDARERVPGRRVERCAAEARPSQVETAETVGGRGEHAAQHLHGVDRVVSEGGDAEMSLSEHQMLDGAAAVREGAQKRRDLLLGEPRGVPQREHPQRAQVGGVEQRTHRREAPPLEPRPDVLEGEAAHLLASLAAGEEGTREDGVGGAALAPSKREHAAIVEQLLGAHRPVGESD